jgi:hypothetical protein
MKETGRAFFWRQKDCFCGKWTGTDEANGITHVSVISKEDWLSEIGAQAINQQKDGLQERGL